METARKRIARVRRRARIRRNVRGTNERPRLSVFRSNRHIYAQVISDESGQTLASASTLKLDGESTGNRAAAHKVGEMVAARCQERSISEVIFDRNGFLYHGRIKEVAEAARAAGLKF